jgi:prepilin peptidase CpaA
MKNFSTAVELLGMLLNHPRYSILLVLLLVASISDCRSYKIPNWLTFGGSAFALIYSVFVPFSPQLGFGWALGGFALGLSLMLPLYMLGMIGAGDVKLMAMVGAFLGMTHTLYAVIFVFVSGGLGALVYALWHHSMLRMFGNIKSTLTALLFSTAAGLRPQMTPIGHESVGKLPFALSITFGTAAFLVANQLGYA